MSDNTMLTADEIAKQLGIQRNTFHAYRARGQAPNPDGVLGRTPWWYQSTITNWNRNRPGQRNLPKDE